MKRISYFEHEAELCRMERTNKRLWLLALTVFASMIASNTFWVFRLLGR